MYRISPDNPVRKCLIFGDPSPDHARIDNFANVLQESIARDREEKSKKWNFDFENETPLEGVYEWIKSDDRNDWIGVEKITEIHEDNYDMRNKNEATPRSYVNDETAPLVRKRKTDRKSIPKDSAAKRKICLD